MLLHGLAEHSGRYEHVAEALTDARYAVRAVDHRGHGRSDGKRAYVKSYARVHGRHRPVPGAGRGRAPRPAADRARPQHGRQPGARARARPSGGRPRPGAQRAGARNPATSLSPIKIKLARLVGKIAPGLRPERLSADAISRDPAVVAAYRADPLVFTGKMSAGVAAALLGAMEAFPARHAELKLPVLLHARHRGSC